MRAHGQHQVGQTRDKSGQTVVVELANLCTAPQSRRDLAGRFLARTASMRQTRDYNRNAAADQRFESVDWAESIVRARSSVPQSSHFQPLDIRLHMLVEG